MRVRTIATGLGVLAVMATMGVGCADSQEDTQSPELVDTDNSAVRGSSCINYLGIVDGSYCPSIPATRGKWISSTLQVAGPEWRPRAVCQFSWQPLTKAEPDLASLAGVVDTAPADVCAMATPSGGSDAGVPFELEPIEAPSPYSMGGAIGCDVCGIEREDGRLWVILPPERIVMRETSVPLDDGTLRHFKIHAPKLARSVLVQLPPPPAGKQWVNGVVPVY